MNMVCIIMNHKYRFIGITKIFCYKLLCYLKSPVRFHLILFERKNDMIPLPLVCFSKLLLCIHHLLKSHICLAVYGSHKSSSLRFLRIHHIIQCPL